MRQLCRQSLAVNLADMVFRQAVHAFDPGQTMGAAKCVPDLSVQVVKSLDLARAFHESERHFSEIGMWRGHHASRPDTRACKQHILYACGSQVFTTAYDDLLQAAGQEKIAICVEISQIP